MIQKSGPVGLVLPVAGVPISAEQVEEREQTSGEKSISEVMVSNISRDHTGRMRVELQIGDSDQLTKRLAYLIDPVARCLHVLLIDAETAVRLFASNDDAFGIAFPGVGQSLSGEREWLNETQPLGIRMIQGIAVEGFRTVHKTVDEPLLTAVEESWVSRDLGLTISVEALSPSWKHTARLQNIHRHEPDSALFEIPPGYTIEDDFEPDR